jgi:hypothetical protein
MKNILLYLLVFTSTVLIKAQPNIEWQSCFGGSASDWAQSIQITTDGGYVVAGYTQSNDSNVSGNHGGDDFWVLKLSSSGAIQWQTCLGGTGIDDAQSIQETADGGYVIAGYSNSNDGDVTGNHGADDFWIVKLNSTGILQWQKSLGGTGWDDALCVTQTIDGGYLITGDSQSNNGDVSGNHGNFDAWLVKLDASGNIQWQKCFGGTGDDTFSKIQQTLDSGYVAIGSSNSTNGDVSGNHGGFDYWVVKLNPTGGIQWHKCFGGSGEDIGYTIIQTADSNYYVSGFTRSNNGDVSGLHGTSGQPDFWVLKLDKTGSLIWQKCLGGTGDDKSYAIEQTIDGGAVVTGYTKSNNGDVSGNHSTNHDYWIVKLDDSGNLEWQKCLGGTGTDWARAIKQTADGGFIVAGFAISTNGDVTDINGNVDYWIVKLHPNATSITENAPNRWQVFPNPSSGNFSIRSNAPEDNAVIKIVDPLGKYIYESHINTESTDVDLSRYSAGIYFISIHSEKHKWQGKVIIE